FPLIANRKRGRNFVGHEIIPGMSEDHANTSESASGSRLAWAASCATSLPEPGDDAMVIENQPTSRQRARVKVRVWLESAVSPREVSPQHRLAVILISAVVFFAIVSFSAFKLAERWWGDE